MRQYEPIWIQVKTEGRCEISTHRKWHKRIIHAMWKEKDLDLEYKLWCSEQSPPIQARLSIQRTGTVIKFSLVLKSDLTQTTVDSI